MDQMTIRAVGQDETGDLVIRFELRRWCGRYAVSAPFVLRRNACRDEHYLRGVVGHMRRGLTDALDYGRDHTATA